MVSLQEFEKVKAEVAKLKAQAVEAKNEVKKTFATTLTGALALVAALFWKDAITNALNKYLPSGPSLALQFATAILLTIVFAYAIYRISKWIK